MNQESEFGGIYPIRFLGNDAAVARDSEGNQMSCKCGRVAGSGIIGNSSYQMFCKDCAPFTKDVAEFVYKPPKGIL